MRDNTPFPGLAMGELFETLLPDFVLGFAFFTALAYAVLARRVHHQRAAITVSVVMGLALAIGLVWWEQRVGLSVIDLGPLAAGFAIIVLAAVMYQAIRQAGGTWAGVGIALGATLLVSRLLPIAWPIPAQFIGTVTTVALLVGILALLMRRGWHSLPAPKSRGRLPAVRHDMSDIRQSRLASDLLGKRFRDLGRAVDKPRLEPADVQDIIRKLRRMLPAEGWLTERLAVLREKTHRMRSGHVARIDEIQEFAADLPTAAKRALSSQLREQYQELGLELRLERLDKAAAAMEERLCEVTKEAERAAAGHDFQRLHDLLKDAEKLQRHTSSLFKTIGRTEKRLVTAARRAAKHARGD